MTNQNEGKYPIWLRSHWEDRRKQTARRVTNAIRQLQKDKAPVTLGNICGVIKEREGISISPATITRNDLAKAAYEASRETKKRSKVQLPIFKELYEGLPPNELKVLQGKASKLRKESKEALIGRLLLSEWKRQQQNQIELRLRDELIRLEEKLLSKK